MDRPEHEQPWTVGILIFDDVEVLDFAGPFEVFSRTRMVPGLESRLSEEAAPFRLFTVARSTDLVTATGGLKVQPDHSLTTAPPIDLLLIPGGFGTRPLLHDVEILTWIRTTAENARWVTSVCTGALLLAEAGLLDHRRATTHSGAHERLAAMGQDITVERAARFVDDGVITAAGVAAGIDMAFHVVEALCGREVADETAEYIEYPRVR